MKVFEATTREEREAAYRFRYEIYVAREGRVQHHADHARRRVEEPLDEHGRVLIATDRGRVVGTLRTNRRSEGPLGHYEHLYGIDRLSPVDRERVSITTKLMVDAAYRGGTCALRLSKLAYQLALEAGVHHDYVDAYDPLVDYFGKLGYEVLDRDLVHPEFGRANLMRINVHDEPHLRRVGSPFLSLLIRSHIAA